MPSNPESPEKTSPIAVAVRDAMQLIQSNAPRTRLRARLRDIRVPIDQDVLVLTSANAALLANQLPGWMNERGGMERAGRAIALFLDRRSASRSNMEKSSR